MVKEKDAIISCQELDKKIANGELKPKKVMGKMVNFIYKDFKKNIKKVLKNT